MQDFMAEALAKIAAMTKSDLVAMLDKHKVSYIDLDTLTVTRGLSIVDTFVCIKSKSVEYDVSAVYSANEHSYDSMAMAA